MPGIRSVASQFGTATGGPEHCLGEEGWILEHLASLRVGRYRVEVDRCNVRRAEGGTGGEDGKAMFAPQSVPSVFCFAWSTFIRDRRLRHRSLQVRLSLRVNVQMTPNFWGVIS